MTEEERVKATRALIRAVPSFATGALAANMLEILNESHEALQAQNDMLRRQLAELDTRVIDDPGSLGIKIGICEQKQYFRTKARAVAMALRSQISLKPYKCDICQNYHLTKKASEVKYRTRGIRAVK